MKRGMPAVMMIGLLAVGVACAEPKVTMTSSVPRAGINLTVYSAAVSLIQERREISLAPGLNEFRINWSGVEVDRSSVRLTPLGNATDITIRDAVQVASDPHTVIWHLEAKRAGTYPFSLSYYAAGFSWNADYLLTVDDQEKTLWLKSNANITNRSGESYPDADIRLVMGDLRIISQRPAASPGPAGPAGAQTAERTVAADSSGTGTAFAREGFAEYTFYALDRPESLDNGDTKRIVLASSNAIPARKVYTYDPNRFGQNVAMEYWVENRKEHNLGPLSPGLVRAYRQERDGRLSLLGEDLLGYVPLGETAKIYLGNAHNIIIETATTDHRRFDEVWSSETEKERRRLLQYTEEFGYTITVKNRKAYAAELVLRQPVPGDAQVIQAAPKPAVQRVGLLEWHLQPAAGETLGYVPF